METVGSATPRFEAAGTFAGFVGAGFDVTERCEAYRALTHLTDELQAQRLATTSSVAFAKCLRGARI